MDEFGLRLDNAIERFQVQLTMATENGINLIRQYSDEGRNQLMRMTSDPSFDGVKSHAREFLSSFARTMSRFKALINEAINTEFVYEQMRLIFQDEISRNNLFFVSVGLGLGTTCGILVGFWIARPSLPTPIMKAIAARSFPKKFNDVGLCKTHVPHLKTSDNVLVRVRAVCVNRIDYKISRGYGRTIRSILNPYTKINPEFPLVLGRACAGIVEAVGKNLKSDLEIGDEVWIVSPWYEPGLGSELIVVNENRIEKKPYTIGFECAASLPYSGCYALNALKRANLNEGNCYGKNFLIEGGCSPVGCILIQLLKKWGGYIVTTCTTRSEPVVKALGADEVIILNPDDLVLAEEGDYFNDYLTMELLKQLDKRLEKHKEYNNFTKTFFDVTFLTTKIILEADFSMFLEPHMVISTVEKENSSDNYSSIIRFLFKYQFLLKRFYNYVCGNDNWEENEPHFCCSELNTLKRYINAGILKTVIDTVFTPNDINEALEHLYSFESIGNTIITFRS